MFVLLFETSLCHMNNDYFLLNGTLYFNTFSLIIWKKIKNLNKNCLQSNK